MKKKQTVELTWVGKAIRAQINPHILVEDPNISYFVRRCSADRYYDNRIIQGDNLLALEALQQEFAGKIKCIYIDPPYNTQSSFTHYEDGVEHSHWLTFMRDRLVLLRKLLREDGFLFVQIDNNEMPYLKVLIDEVFGRACFINDIVWKRRGGSANPNNRLNNVTDYLLWYSKTADAPIQPVHSLDDDRTQAYIVERFTNEIAGRKFMLAPIERNAKLGLRANLRYEYQGYIPEFGWMMSRTNLERMDAEGRLHWNSKGRPNRRVYLDEYRGQPVGNLWTDIKVINPMSSERLDFDGQKPEKLLQRVLQLATREGDIVLDAFAGTGTTGAVAQKMNRRWIMVEMGDQCHTHLIPRLRRVLEGEDACGITESTGWPGGGGFRFFRLAPES